MSYTISLNIRNDTTESLAVVEKTCWYYANGGIWTEHGSNHALTMGGSGTSGILRFRSDSGELFTAIVGIHNYNPWGDVQVDLAGGDTGVKLNPEYYSGGRLSGEAHSEIQRPTSKGRNVKLYFDAREGRQVSAVLHYF
ncbi:fungal fruit body lectin [Aspergillus varians]